MRPKDLFDLSGRVAIVTGGYTGLGEQIAGALLEAGANIAICARRVERWQDGFDRLQRIASGEGRRLMGKSCDVTIKDSVDGFVAEVVKLFGGVQILVNSAGISWGADSQTMKLEDWEKVLRTNLTGTFIVSQSAGRVMIASGGGSIINMSSIAGLFGTDPEVLDALGYSTSKAGVIGFTRDLALKWARYNVRVNAIAPGWFRTHLSEGVISARKEKILSSIPMRRLGSQDDLKGAAVFLASDASSYVTGQTLCVDGGQAAGR